MKIKSFLVRTRGPLISIVAQVLTLGASLLPVLFRLESALVVAVLVSAVVSVVVHPATLAAATRLPVAADDVQASAMRVAGKHVLIAVTVTAALVFAGLEFTGAHDWAVTVGLIALLVASQGAYTLVFAEAVRLGSYMLVATLRLVYGIIVVGATFMVCTLWASGAGLVAAYAFAYIAASAGTWYFLISPRLVATKRPRWTIRETMRQVSAARPYAFSLGLGSFAAQGPGLALAQLGGLAPVWAIMTRVGSGFQTLGGSVLGPAIDMRVASAVRSGSLSKARVGVVSGLLAGIALGAVCFLGIVVVLIYTGYEWSSESRTIVLVSLLMFWVPQAVLAVVGRLLALLGRGKTVLALDGIRALATLLGLLVLSGAPLIAALSVTSVVSVAAYVLAVLRATRRPHFHST